MPGGSARGCVPTWWRSGSACRRRVRRAPPRSRRRPRGRRARRADRGGPSPGRTGSAERRDRRACRQGNGFRWNPKQIRVIRRVAPYRRPTGSPTTVSASIRRGSSIGTKPDRRGTAAPPPPAAQVDLSGLASLKALLRIRPFRRLWLVLGLSSLGDWLGLLASAIFASAQVTGSGAKGVAFGSVVAVRMLPALILGPLAGVVADRWDRRYTMVISDLTRFVMFASIPRITPLTSDSKIIVAWAGVATFVIEAMQMAWGPAKDAAVPNLLPRARLESANQLTLATTYGVTPVLAGLTLAALTTIVNTLHKTTGRSPFDPTHVGLYFDALTFLATALTVFFGIKEISGRAGPRPSKKPPLWRGVVSGRADVGRTPLGGAAVPGVLRALVGAGGGGRRAPGLAPAPLAGAAALPHP